MTNLGKEILSLRMQDNDANAVTVKDYLIRLLITLWREVEDFSGKRPFGNSSWIYDLYKPLIVAGLVWGELDEDGYIEEIETSEADALIEEAIKSL